MYVVFFIVDALFDLLSYCAFSIRGLMPYVLCRDALIDVAGQFIPDVPMGSEALFNVHRTFRQVAKQLAALPLVKWAHE